MYTDGEMDFTQEQIQRQIQTLNWKLLDCRGCKEKWIKPETFDSWYLAMQAFARGGKCGGQAWDGVRTMVRP